VKERRKLLLAGSKLSGEIPEEVEADSERTRNGALAGGEG
jgi:hypothetical protein